MVVSSAKLPSSEKPRRNPSTGAASTSSTTVPPTANSHGRDWTTRLSRYQTVSRSGLASLCRIARRSGLAEVLNDPATSTTTASGMATSSSLKPVPNPSSATPISAEAATPRTRVVPTRSPRRPMAAGSSVTDPAITRATVVAAARPSPATNGRPMSSRPSSDTTTVAPAKITDRPAESRAAAVASSGVRPRPSHSR